MWRHRHLLTIDSLSREDIETILDRALVHYASQENKSGTLRGVTVVNLFFESSTRTRSSFEIAGKRLSADVINLSANGSSTSKGESLLDTVRNVAAMRTDIVVMRHDQSGAARFVASRTRASVVNAGDGAHEHPTQALLDAFTIRRHKGSLDGLTVAICGDITHSRVARSNALLLQRFGCRVRLCAPATLLPRGGERLGESVETTTDLRTALEDADVVMMLRIQNERLAGTFLSTTREYSRTFGLGQESLAWAKPDALVITRGQ